MLDQLEALLRALLGDADVQDFVDAHHNEAALRRAATCLRQAALHVADAAAG